MTSVSPPKTPIRRTSRRGQRKMPAAATRTDFARSVLKKFRVLFSSIKTHYREVEISCGVSGSQLWALTEIGRHPGISVSELATSLLVHQSTASNLLDGLEGKAFIAKYRTKEDQRVVRLRLTQQGRKLLSAAPEPTVGVLLDALQKLPEETLWGLSMNMEALTAIMNRKDEDAAARPLSDL